MDLSPDVQNLHEPMRFIKSRNESISPLATMCKNSCDFDIIDVNRINFDNDETWLYKVSSSSESPITDLKDWLYNDTNETNDDDYFPNSETVQKISPNEFHKIIDTRTFTRPKKRFTRPSIEKYNEEVYGGSRSIENEKGSSLESMKKSVDSGLLSSNSIIQEATESIVTSSNPLSFDLSQPTNSYYFENILANAGDVDSFQNMSPPSLVNSMCSSTFANLMESSFIKNDPVLREIRDTDYTETVLLQDSEPPMFQSITESCSSINSDTPENFLKKLSFNGTFRKNLSSEFEESVASETSDKLCADLNITYEKPKETDLALQNLENGISDDFQEVNSQPNFNGTYRRTPKQNGTFRKSDVRNATLILNSKFETSNNEVQDQNTTQTLIKDSSLKSFERKKSFSNNTIINADSIEDMKKQLSDAVQITDLNRLSYCLDEESIRLDSVYTENDDFNKTINMKRSSIGCSTGSADSLDRMSSLSSGSRESNKMLNMADVDAIVEMQERSLQQVMSTPKPNTTPKKLWENNFISPIISNERLSDSDLSSNDEYKSVKSTLSKASLENYSSKPTKSMGYLGGNIDTKMRTNQRSTYTLASQKPLQAISSNIRSSYSNLKTIQSNIPGSQPNIYKPGNVVRAPASATNLLTMRHKLKGSYTSLRPISANLPVAPSITPDLNTTTTLPRTAKPNVTHNIDGHAKIVEVAPMPREKVVPGDSQFVKPQQPRVSGLPRPTGIPRPASRIPGPRTNIRPASSRSTVRRQTKDDYQ